MGRTAQGERSDGPEESDRKDQRRAMGRAAQGERSEGPEESDRKGRTRRAIGRTAQGERSEGPEESDGEDRQDDRTHFNIWRVYDFANRGKPQTVTGMREKGVKQLRMCCLVSVVEIGGCLSPIPTTDLCRSVVTCLHL